MGYIPASLRKLASDWEDAIPSAVFSGVAPSSPDAYGYHNSANGLINSGQSNDYSLKLEGDKLSDGIDREAFCGLDVSMNRVDMILVTNRVYKSWKDKDDPRLDKHREGIGTLDGSNVTYMDFQSGQLGSADGTHLWHFHKGGLRLYINDQEANNAFLSVVKGETYAQYSQGTPAPQPPQGEDMTTQDDAEAWRIDAITAGSDTVRGGPVKGEEMWLVQHIKSIEDKLNNVQAQPDVVSLQAKVTELETKVDAILSLFKSVGEALKGG